MQFHNRSISTKNISKNRGRCTGNIINIIMLIIPLEHRIKEDFSLQFVNVSEAFSSEAKIFRKLRTEYRLVRVHSRKLSRVRQLGSLGGAGRDTFFLLPFMMSGRISDKGDLCRAEH